MREEEDIETILLNVNFHLPSSPSTTRSAIVFGTNSDLGRAAASSRLQKKKWREEKVFSSLSISAIINLLFLHGFNKTTEYFGTLTVKVEKSLSEVC